MAGIIEKENPNKEAYILDVAAGTGLFGEKVSSDQILDIDGVRCGLLIKTPLKGRAQLPMRSVYEYWSVMFLHNLL